MTGVVRKRHYCFYIRCMITTTDNRVLRSKMLEVCLLKQQSLIDDFNTRIISLLAGNGLGNEEEYDNQVLAQRTQRNDEVDGLLQARNLAYLEMNELLRLSRLPYAVHTQVEPGAVVVTDRDTVFISVSIEQFEVDGEPFIGISTQSPRYQIMKGLRKGNTFRCKGRKYTITDIF